MKKLTLAALATFAFVLAALPVAASVDQEQIEEECQEAAVAEEIAANEMAEFIADCIAETVESEDGDSEDEEKQD